MDNKETNLLKIQKGIIDTGDGSKFLNDKLEYGQIKQKELLQVTKLGVSAPHEVELTISPTQDFKLPDINVLKYVPGTGSQILDVCTFDNGDESDFEPNDKVEFDGSMKLKTTYDQTFIKDGDFYKTTFNKANLNILSMEIF